MTFSLDFVLSLECGIKQGSRLPRYDFHILHIIAKKYPHNAPEETAALEFRPVAKSESSRMPLQILRPAFWATATVL